MRRRILVVTPWAPVAAPDHGGAVVSRGLIGALAELHEVVVLHLEPGRNLDARLGPRCLALEEFQARVSGRWPARLRGAVALARGRSLWAAEIGMRGLQREVAKLSRQWQPDVVHVMYGVLGEALAGSEPRSIRVVTIMDPACSVGDHVPLQHSGLAIAHRLDARAAVRQERRVMRLADAVVVLTERDRSLLRQLDRTAELVAIPVGVEVPPTALDATGEEPETVLFVGNFMHPPNVDAALALGRRIMPEVWRTHPHVRLEVVGASPPPEVRELVSGVVDVTGMVTSIVPHLDRAAVVVAPLTIGGGMRVKVLEALAAGKAVVASTPAAEGVTARAGMELVLADGDVETASAIVRLVDDVDARRQLALRGRKWAERELSWAAVARRYEELYDRLDLKRQR